MKSAIMRGGSPPDIAVLKLQVNYNFGVPTELLASTVSTDKLIKPVNIKTS
jgi:hypothetical protein